MKSFEKITLLGVELTNTTEEEVLEFISTGLSNSHEKYFIVTPNPELLVIASKDKEYKKILNSAKLALPDGVGVMLGAQLMGKPLKERIAGVDLVKSLCNHISKQPITVGFLGAGPNVAVQTAECLKKLYPDLKISFAQSEWEDALKHIKTDILFVAFGSPKQEIWIKNNLDKIPVKVAIGVGGSFDFISGKVRRAPMLIRRLGLEWLFRLITQPWRIKRQFSLITFIYLIIKQKLSR